MSEPSSKEPKDEPESNPLDLTDLQSFSFGTQWTDAGKKHKLGDRQGSGRGPGQGRRPDRRAPGSAPGRDRRPPRRSFSGREAGSESIKNPSEDSRERGDRRFQNRGQRPRGEGEERRRGHFVDKPYESPVFDISFYPDDSGFTTIIKALRTNHITYELFHVAKIFLEKSDRYVASVTRKAPKGEKPERVFVSIPDGMPFETEEEAIQHAITHHAESLFDTKEVEVEAPKGNFLFINRCGITKKLLGPPNYHRYEEFLNHHHQTQLKNMPFERFKASIEQIREEAVVAEWLESMTKTIHYTSKVEEGEEAQTFVSLSDAIGFLRTTQRDKIVRGVNYARVSGVTLDKFANTEASRAVAGELARQRRFPLETANAIRGRLRREKFSIYKKGSKGVTLICATRRNFRTKGQVMSVTLDRLIRFLEANQNIKAKALPSAYEEWLKENFPDVVYEEKKLFQDLHWLIADGYVSHFSDDSLFAQPVLENEPKPKTASHRKEKAEEPDLRKESAKDVANRVEATEGSGGEKPNTAPEDASENVNTSSAETSGSVSASESKEDPTIAETVESTQDVEAPEPAVEEKIEETLVKETSIEEATPTDKPALDEAPMEESAMQEKEVAPETSVDEPVIEEEAVAETTEDPLESVEPKAKEQEEDPSSRKAKSEA